MVAELDTGAFLKHTQTRTQRELIDQIYASQHFDDSIDSINNSITGQQLAAMSESNKMRTWSEKAENEEERSAQVTRTGCDEWLGNAQHK